MTNGNEAGPGNLDKKTVDLQRADFLFFFSFRLSQGKVNLQEDIFKWLKMNYPDIQVDFEALKPLAMKRAMDVVLEGRGIKHSPNIMSDPTYRRQPTTEALITDTNDIMLDIWRRVLKESGKTENKEQLLSKLLTSFINQDYIFLVERGGRPTVQHKFFSYVCSNILLGLPSGMKEYDQMLAQLKEYLVSSVSDKKIDSESRERLRQIIEAHNAHYPDKQVKLENL